VLVANGVYELYAQPDAERQPNPDADADTHIIANGVCLSFKKGVAHANAVFQPSVNGNPNVERQPYVDF
jgi:hypothetical protein